MKIDDIILLGRCLENAKAIREAFCRLSEDCSPEQWEALNSAPSLARLLVECEELNDTLSMMEE